VATAIVAPDSLGAAQNAVADISVALTVNGSSNGVPAVAVRLRGPADVVGIDANQIIRTDPQPGSTDFEPTYFPCVEFDRPDYPWMFSPASANANSKLRPWMCLVVVQKQAGVTITKAPDVPLPMLQITTPAKPAKELPDLVDCWAWAHAQAAGDDSLAPTVQAALDGPPDANLSRLIAPRVLAPDTEYIACVVPTYEVGRKTGLGITVADKDLLLATAPTPLAPAWKTTQATVQLPVYFQWEFRTGAGGDFQTLASKLRPESTSSTLGRRAVDISQPGFQPQPPATPFPPTAALNVEGALQPAGRGNVAEPWDPTIAQPFQQELAKIVNAPATSLIVTPNGDPLLAPPLYGTWHAQLNKATQGGTKWFDQLNLDPRLRSVAAFGTRVVQEHQEALMASAWEQAAELQKANQRMRQMQLSLAVNESIHTRHINTLSDEATLRIAAPAFPRLRVAADNMVSLMAGATLPMPAVGAAMRRIGRQRGPLTRRMAAQGNYFRVPNNSWVAQLSFGMVMSPPGPPPLRWGADFNVSPLFGFRDYSLLTAANVAAEPKKPFWIYPEGQLPSPWPFPLFDNPAWPFDDAPAADFRRAAIDHLTAVDPARSGRHGGGHHFVPQATTQQIKDLIKPRVAFQILGEATLSLGPNSTPSVRPGGTAIGVESVMVAPTFPQPMYEPLRDISQELLLPGLDGVPADRIMGLETNRRFVEAFMVGLNFEMGRELLWRGYPTDQRGTYFSQFWAVAGSNSPRPDITPIDQWGTRSLGDAQGAPQREQFVMLMRSALLRRYPDAVVCLTPAVLTNGVRGPSTDDTTEQFPVFSGSMKPDVSFFGFDISTTNALTGNGGLGYYVVIQEHPTAPRFGLTGPVPATTVYVNANVAKPAGFPVPTGLVWGSNAAHTAGFVRRPPVRLAIHTSLLIASS
jgi:hypothetical protein